MESYNDVFADIVNHLLFRKELIEQELLEDGPTESIYKAADESFAEQRRDVAKYYKKDSLLISVLGIENQSVVDTDMAIRLMGYDYAAYREQIKSGTVRRCPVISTVLYFGKQEWKRPFSLKEILEIPEGFQSFVQDYRFHVIDVPRLSEKVRETLTSDFRMIADFFAEREAGNYEPSNREIRHIEAFMEMMKVFTSDRRYGEMTEELVKKKRKGEVVTMCTVLDSYINKGIKQGIEQGQEELIRRMYKNGMKISEIEKNTEIAAEKLWKILGLEQE